MGHFGGRGAISKLYWTLFSLFLGEFSLPLFLSSDQNILLTPLYSVRGRDTKEKLHTKAVIFPQLRKRKYPLCVNFLAQWSFLAFVPNPNHIRSTLLAGRRGKGCLPAALTSLHFIFKMKYCVITKILFSQNSAWDGKMLMI